MGAVFFCFICVRFSQRRFLRFSSSRVQSILLKQRVDAVLRIFRKSVDFGFGFVGEQWTRLPAAFRGRFLYASLQPRTLEHCTEHCPSTTRGRDRKRSVSRQIVCSATFSRRDQIDSWTSALW